MDIIITTGLLAALFALIIVLDVSGNRRHLKEVVVAGMVLAFISLSLPQYFAAGTLLKNDLFTLFFSLIFLVVSLLVVLSSNEATAVYNGDVILATIGMILAAASNNLIMLFVSIELVTSPTYALVAYHKTHQRLEAGVKYFVVGIVASALMILGVALLVATTGTSTISELHLSTDPLFLLGVGAFIAGLGFKLGLFPFNFWIPDVYQGAPPEVAGLLAGASKKAAYAALLRVALVLVALHNWALLFAVLSALTMTIANLIALLQTNARRLLAYSIMSQAGFLLMGVAVATQLGYSATLFHAFTHAFMVLGAFLVLGVFLSHKVETLDQLKGVGWRNPLLGVSLSLFLFSLAGIPLLSGFASKFYLFYATIQGGLWWLAVLAILNSVIALYYYFKIVRAMYAYPGGGEYHLRKGTLIAIWVCLILTVAAGVYPWLFIDFAVKAIAAMM